VSEKSGRSQLGEKTFQEIKHPPPVLIEQALAA
jgi:hypothetical protein